MESATAGAVSLTRSRNAARKHPPTHPRADWTQTASAVAAETTAALNALGVANVGKIKNPPPPPPSEPPAAKPPVTDEKKKKKKSSKDGEDSADKKKETPKQSFANEGAKRTALLRRRRGRDVKDKTAESGKSNVDSSATNTRNTTTQPGGDETKTKDQEEVLNKFLHNQGNIHITALAETDTDTTGNGGNGAITVKTNTTKPSIKLDKFGFILNLDDHGVIHHLSDEENNVVASLPNTAGLQEPTSTRAATTTTTTSTTVKKSMKRTYKLERKIIIRREKKWTTMMDHWETTRKKHQKKLRKRVRKGVPDSLRGSAWALLCNVPNKIQFEHPGLYEKLVLQATRADNGEGGSVRGLTTRDTIDRDINRTFPRHHMFYDGDDESSLDGDDSSDASSVAFLDNAVGKGTGIGTGTGGGGGTLIGGRNAAGTVTGESGTDIPSWIREEEEDEEGKVEDKNTPSLPSWARGGGGTTDAQKQGGSALVSSSGRRSPFEKASKLFDAIQQCNGQAGLNNVADEEDFTAEQQVLWEKTVAEASSDAAKVNGKSGRETTVTAATTKASSLPSASAAEAAEKKLVKNSNATNKKEKDSGKRQGGQAALRRVLRAYSVYDREVGYCQGMNFIAAMFITFVSEEEAFWLLVAVMNEPPCMMRGLFGEGMSGAHRVLYVAEKLIAQFLPRLSQHLERENVHITMYATQWLLTLYTSSFPFELVTRVWDCFLAEGWKIVYRVMLALLEQASPDLLKLHFEDILSYFREIPSNVDGPATLEAAIKIPLRKKHIARYEKEWLASQQ